MGYEEFKKGMLEGLIGLYGESAEVTPVILNGNNGMKYEGVQVSVKGVECSAYPVIRLDKLYAAHREGGMGMEGCLAEAREKVERGQLPKEAAKLPGMAADWGSAKGNVYPILLSTKRNKGLLRHLASMEMLDLSIAYSIRLDLDGAVSASIKVSKGMLKGYGVSLQELHGKAMENMGKDGYRFEDMGDLMERIFKDMGGGAPSCERGQMFLFTNRSGVYGAAGILDKGILKGFSKGRDLFILPSSIHETILLPAHGWDCERELDKAVREVNKTCVAEEDVLSDHIYYYDGKANEIRMRR